jgi:transcriptional regulator with XRE-family HTH domain
LWSGGKYMSDNKLNELFGQKVRLLRMSKGLSQEELGLQAGLHRTYIGQIERAEKNISLQNIGKLANTLDIDIQELFDFKEIYSYKKK